MKRCIIFSGGNVVGTEYLPSIDDSTLIISADGGYLNALKLNIIPNLCLGDFDTLKVDIHSSCQMVKFPPEKDDTDTMLCIKEAIYRACDSVYIYGALGGRFDHAMANVQALEYLTNRGTIGYIVDSQNLITMQKESIRTYKNITNFRYFSILSVSHTAEVSADGLKYPLDRTILTREFPLGVSNEILTDTFNITVHNGTILAIYSKD